MRRVLPLASLTVTAVLSSCTAGAGLSGGAGDPNLFDVVPPVPSVPVVTGEYVVRATSIVTNPKDELDQYQALKDTITINIAPGPASNVLDLSGEYLDQRINDLVYLKDKGGNTWEAVGNGVQMDITTDATGAPQSYLVGVQSTSTTNTPILSQRTFSFGYPLPGSAPGLYLANVQTNDSIYPLDPGADNCFVMREDGVCQWEDMIGINLFHYWVDYAHNCLRAQFTEFNSSNEPPNLEQEDILDLPLYTGGQRNVTNHESGDHVETWNYGGAYFSVTSPGVYYGTVSSPAGIYTGHPYYLTGTGDSTVYFTVNQGAITVALTEGEKTDTLGIVSLSATDLIAVMGEGAGGYELMDLWRNGPVGDTNLMEPNGAMLTVGTYTYGAHGNPDTEVGSYSIPVVINDPNGTTPP